MIKVKISNTELVKSKLQNVIAKVEGYYQEAKGDCALWNSPTYSSEGVRNRMEKIREALYQDIERLAADMEYVEPTKNTTNGINNTEDRQS
jgi:hypothetical protein